MNKYNAKDFLPLVQALADGKTIQYFHLIDGWIDMVEIGQGEATEYRIKPEPPKPREWEIALGMHKVVAVCGPLLNPGELIKVREIIE